MLTKRHVQDGYPPSDREVVPFFTQQYKNFDSARLAFSLFLGYLFDQVTKLVDKDHNLASALGWRDWLDRRAAQGNGSNRDDLYRRVLEEVSLDVCGYFSTRVGVTSYAAYKEIANRLKQTTLEGLPMVISIA